MELPGNLRELIDLIDIIRAYIPATEQPISVKQMIQVIKDRVYGGQKLFNFDPKQRDTNIVRVLKMTERNARLTAEIVGCSHQTVYTIGQEKGLLLPR